MELGPSVLGGAPFILDIVIWCRIVSVAFDLLGNHLIGGLAARGRMLTCHTLFGKFNLDLLGVFGSRPNMGSKEKHSAGSISWESRLFVAQPARRAGIVALQDMGVPKIDTLVVSWSANHSWKTCI